MFTTSSIIDNLNQSEGLEYKKLCKSLKITKKGFNLLFFASKGLYKRSLGQTTWLVSN